MPYHTALTTTIGLIGAVLPVHDPGEMHSLDPRNIPTFSLIFAFIFTACTDSPEPGARERPVARLELRPASLELPRGLDARLQVLAWDAKGDPIAEPALRWRSSDPEVAEVDASGRVLALSLGEAEIEAEADGISARARVKVRDPRLESLRIEPREPKVYEGESLLLKAVILDELGEVVEGLPVEWTTDKPLYVEVDETGLATGLWADQSATITARHAALEDSVLVEVLAPLALVRVEPLRASLIEDESFRFSVEIFDAGMMPVDLPVVWSSEDEEVVTIDQEGRVKARGLGKARIFAEVGGKSSWAEVEVFPRAHRLEVTVEPSTLRPWGMVQPRAVARDARGAIVEGLKIEWSSDRPQVASLLGNSTIAARSQGKALIRARNERHGVEASVELTVLEEGIFHFSGPPGAVFVGGDTFQLHLEVETASGERVPAIEPLWFSHDESVATIDTEGRVEIIGVGQATLGVRAEGHTLALDRPAVVRLEEMALGQRTTCGRAKNGTVWCWGAKAMKVDGDLEWVPWWVPERVGKGIVSIHPGEGSCEEFPEVGSVCDLVYGIREDGSVVALRLGLPPLEIPGPSFLRVSGAGSELCGITSEGGVACREGPPHDAPAADLLLGLAGRCILGTNGAMDCRGEGPFAVDLSARSFSIGGAFPLVLGPRHGCGIDALGEAFCWGENESGQVRAPPDEEEVWVDPAPVAPGIRSVAVGETVSLFVSDEKEISAQGVGVHDLLVSEFPRQGEVRAVFASPGGHRCLLLDSGRPYCWGKNDMGQAGYPPQGPVGGRYPVAVPSGIPPEEPLLAPRNVGGVCGLTDNFEEDRC